MSGLSALFYKEMLRFWKVMVQTVVAPVVTALLYLLIFSHVLEAHVEVYPGVSYTSFLVPGLVMMSMLQNAFANSSSSLIQSKMQGNIVFVLLPGGFGTLDEIFETVTLMQTGKIETMPVVVLGSDFWTPMRDFIVDSMLKEKTIGMDDVELISRAEKPEDVISIIDKN